MCKCVLNILRSIGCLFILMFSSFSICVFGYEEVDSVKRNIHLGDFKFFDDEVKVCDFFYCVTIGVGECKKPSVFSDFSILYVDKNNSLNLKLCMCMVNSCKNLPVDQSEWSSVCESEAICQRIGQKFVEPLPFCSMIFEEKNIMRFVPIEFSRQTFFNPGIRLIIADNGMLYKQDFFLSGDDFIQKDCEVIFGQKVYKFKIYRFGHNNICADYYYQGRSLNKCVPIPVLPQPILSRSEYGKVKVSFITTDLDQNLVFEDGVLNKAGIKIIKPKINLDNHQFYLYEGCTNGEILNETEYCLNGEMSIIKYQHDDKITVKCINGLSAVFGYVLKIKEKGYDRHIWLKPLPDKMVRYVRIKPKKYIQCADYEYDLKNETQDFLDEILINDNDYYFFANKHNRSEKLNIYPGNNPCNDLKDSFYLYQNTRLRLKKQNSTDLYPEVLTQFTESGQFDAEVLRYVNADNKEKLSLDIMFKDKLNFLDAYSMGMCVDNFESRTYAAEKTAINSSGFKKNINDHSINVWLHPPKFTDVYNIPSKCDFVRVEIWGGGQSGKIDVKNWESKEGKPGQYVMGMFKIKKSSEYFLKIQLREMHNQILDDGRDTGTDAIVRFCKKDKRLPEKETCEVELIANGGGKLPSVSRRNVIANNVIRDKRMLYYRVVDGPKDRKSENIPSNKRIRFIPYQNFIKENLWEEIEQDVCSSGNLLEENTSKYFGAGGCADVKTHSTEKGAGGMVKITCEDWYHEK